MTAPDRYAVLGNPVEHSRSPWIHTRFARMTGQPIDYGRVLAPLDAFAATVRDFHAAGARGCNVTMPFKFEAAKLATRRTPRAELAGACNTLRLEADGSIHGDNTDGAGLVADVQKNAGLDLRGRDILLVGAGGAVAGVLGPLLEAAPRRIAIANRTLDKARALVRSHAVYAAAKGVELSAHPLDAIPGSWHLVVNGTASSLGGAGVPVSRSVLAPGALALDMMYGPAANAFVEWAREHGATGRDGLGMLVEQAADAFSFYRGVRPPTRDVLAQLRALVDGK